MARAYSGVLGAIAMCLVILRGLAMGQLPNEILSQSLVVFCGLSVIGFWIGTMAEKTVSDSVENQFRSEMARLHSAATKANSKSLE